MLTDANIRGAMILVALLVGVVIGAFLFENGHEKNGAARYRAQLDEDCKLVGFHRIGQNVYLCKDVKAAEKDVMEQQNSTVEGAQ